MKLQEMQVGSKCVLLPPSHFTLTTPSSYQLQGKDAVGPHKSAASRNVSLPRAERIEASTTTGCRGDAASSSSVVTTQSYREPVIAGRAARTQKAHLHVNVACSASDACAAGTQPGFERLSLHPGRYGTQENGDKLSHWLPKTRSEARQRQMRSRSVSSHHQHNWKNSSSPLPSVAAGDGSRSGRGSTIVSTTNTQVEGERGSETSNAVPDNIEEVIARSVAARCQKIDKSLEFYGDLRRKWRGGSPPPSTATLTTTATTGTSEEASSSLRRAENANGGNADACANHFSNQTAPTSTSTQRQRGGEAVSKPFSVTKRPVRGDYHLQKASRGAATAERLRPRGRTQEERDSVYVSAEVSQKHTLNDLSSRPPAHNRGTSGRGVQSTFHPSTPRNTTPENQRSEVKHTDISARATSVVIQPIPHNSSAISTQEASLCVQPQHQTPNSTQIHPTPKTWFGNTARPTTRQVAEEEEEEDEFNDFDSVQQDSESESVEPLSGTFGKPVLTGATPLSPPSVSESPGVGLGEATWSTCGVECEAVGERKAFTRTRNDTELARVLQAEEESRAGTTLTPNTSNDLALAQQIQKELNQTSEDKEHTNTADSAAMASYSYRSNITSAFVIHEDEYRFDTGYQLGREFIVYDHNSPIMEQRERNRNIPHTSVRRNNYSGLWDDDYRDRCFDEVGYRNLVCERLQRYERSQWAAEGGTGIVTGCVRDMTRRQAILDREEQDLAFEGRQDLEEIPSGLDSVIIQKISHEYVYKEKQQPKDESVKPVTQCAVCLDEFHVGEPLRLIPCSHTFHRFCIDKWLVENSDCPVCKADIVSLARMMGVKVDQEKYKKRYW